MERFIRDFRALLLHGLSVHPIHHGKAHRRDRYNLFGFFNKRRNKRLLITTRLSPRINGPYRKIRRKRFQVRGGWVFQTFQATKTVNCYHKAGSLEGSRAQCI